MNWDPVLSLAGDTMALAKKPTSSKVFINQPDNENTTKLTVRILQAEIDLLDALVLGEVDCENRGQFVREAIEHYTRLSRQQRTRFRKGLAGAHGDKNPYKRERGRPKGVRNKPKPEPQPVEAATQAPKTTPTKAPGVPVVATSRPSAVSVPSVAVSRPKPVPRGSDGW